MTKIRYATPRSIHEQYRKARKARKYQYVGFIIFFYPFFFMGTFIDATGNEVSRTKCEIYTRVMGYYRPVTQFNNGKKSEFYTRDYFHSETTCCA